MRTSVAAPRALRWLGGLVLAVAVLTVALAVGRAQQLAPQQPKKQAEPGIVPKALREQARNELEILEAQLEVHNAVVEEFKVRLEQAKQVLVGLERVGESVPQRRLLEARAAVTMLQAQFKVKHAERRVGEVRVSHARVPAFLTVRSRPTIATGGLAPTSIGTSSKTTFCSGCLAASAGEDKPERVLD